MKKKLLTPDLFLGKIAEGTYVALKTLIETSYYSQVAFKNVSTLNDKKNWLKEYCTIKMTCSRRSGHSTAIAKLIPEYFNRALILAHTLDMTKRNLERFLQMGEKDKYLNGEIIQKYTCNKIITESSEYIFSSINCLDKFRGEKFQAIVVDVACLVSKNEIEEIYDILGDCMNIYSEKFFIFIE